MSTRLKLPPGSTNSAGTLLRTRGRPGSSRAICGGRGGAVEELEHRVDPGLDVSRGAGLLGPGAKQLVRDHEGREPAPPERPWGGPAARLLGLGLQLRAPP